MSKKRRWKRKRNRNQIISSVEVKKIVDRTLRTFVKGANVRKDWCPNCGGSGHIHGCKCNNALTGCCEKCDGSGYIDIINIKKELCSNCGGSGHIYNCKCRDILVLVGCCEKCVGTGYINASIDHS
jgi:DnaJ-class molecular chaperone